jgi:hypothetical protein
VAKTELCSQRSGEAKKTCSCATRVVAWTNRRRRFLAQCYRAPKKVVVVGALSKDAQRYSEFVAVCDIGLANCFRRTDRSSVLIARAKSSSTLVRWNRFRSAIPRLDSIALRKK